MTRYQTPVEIDDDPFIRIRCVGAGGRLKDAGKWREKHCSRQKTHRSVGGLATAETYSVLNC